MTAGTVFNKLDDLTALSRDVDDDGVTGDRRAAAAESVLYYATQRQLTDSGEDTTSVITDLLTDLMHLCSACGFEPERFELMVMTAGMNYAAESGQES